MMSGGAELDALDARAGARSSTSRRRDERARRRRRRPPSPARARRRIGVGLIGFGWLGPGPQPLAAAHPDAVRRARVRPRARRLRRHRARRASTRRSARSASRAAATDWRAVIDDPAVDVVFDRRAEHAAPRARRGRRAGRQARLLREAGRRHAGADRPRRAGRARDAGVITGVGYNYRWAPLVRYAAQLIADGRSGEITNYRGRFFSMYGSDPLGLLSWRFLRRRGRLRRDERPAQPRGRPRAHAARADRARGRARPRRSSPSARWRSPGQGHYGRGAPERPARRGDQRGLRRDAVRVRLAARAGRFEASRTIVGPESQMAFDVYGTKGALGWNLEQLNELRALPRRRRAAHRLPHGLRRRPLPLPRRLRAGQRQRHRLRGPRRDRGLRVLPRGRRGAPVRAGLRRGARLGLACRRRCCARRSRGAGRTSCRCGRGDGAGEPAGRAGRRRGHAAAAHRRHRRRAHRAHARRAARAPGRRAPRWPWSTTSPPRRPTPPGPSSASPSRPAPTSCSLHADVDAVAICSSTDDPRRPARRRGRAPARRRSARSRSRWISPRSTARWPPSRGAGVAVQIGFNRRFDPAHQSVARAVADGTIGDVHLVRISSRDPAPPPLEYVRGSGGIFLDMTIHDFDMARYVTGSEVVEVYARGALRVEPSFAEAGDVDTAVVTLDARQRLPDRDRQQPPGGLRLRPARRGVRRGWAWRPRRTRWPTRRSCATARGHAARRRCRTSSSIATSPATCASGRRSSPRSATGATPPVTAADGRAPLVIGLAAWRSLRERRPVAVDEVDGGGAHGRDRPASQPSA